MPGISGPKPKVVQPAASGAPALGASPANATAGTPGEDVAAAAGSAAGPTGNAATGPLAPSDGIDAPGAAMAAAHHAVGSSAGTSAPVAGPQGGMPGAGNLFSTLLSEVGASNQRKTHKQRSDAAKSNRPLNAAQELEAFQATLAKGEVPTHLPLAALHDLPIPSSGLVLQLDAATVAGQRVVLRRVVHPEHGEGVEMRLKLRHPEDIQRVVEQMAAAGAKKGEWRAAAKNVDDDGRYLIDPNTTATPYPNAATASHSSARGDKAAEACLLEVGDRFEVRVLPDNSARAVAGLVSIRAYHGSQKSTVARRLQSALELAGLQAVAADSTPRTRALYNQLRILWQSDPKAAQKFADMPLGTALARKEVENALTAAGVDAKQAGQMPTKEVFPGHFTTLHPGQGDKYREMGVQYLFSGVRRVDQVVAILEGDGLMSTRERYARGMIINGASSEADLASGGADYVFSRMVTDAAKGKSFSSSFAAGDYQLVYDTDVLDRTDWFAYPRDNFGSTRDLEKFTGRQYGKELVDSLATGGFSGYANNNEVMFQTGLAKRDIARIYTSTEEKKTALIEALEAKGIKDLNGKPLAEAIELRTQMVESDGGNV